MLPWDMAIFIHESEHPLMRTMTHMSFHVWQDRLFGPSGGWDNSHMNQKEARISIQLEINALMHAMKSIGDERVNAIRDALSIRAERRRVFPAAAARHENVFEFHEGIATYSDTILSEITMEEILADLRLRAEGIRYHPSLMGVFGYTTGALYGHLLDTTDVNWREGIRYGVDLGQLLKDAIGITELTTFDEIDLSQYGYADILAFETERVIAHERVVEDIRTAFANEAVMNIPTTMRNPGMNVSLASILIVPGLGQVFGAIVMFDGVFGRFEMHDGFYVPGRGFIATDMRQVGNRVYGPGWIIELNEGFEVYPTRGGNYTVRRK